MKKFVFYLFVIVVGLAIGCGPNVSLRGKVTFADGTPLETGMVIVANDNVLSRGEIQPNGSYVIGSLSKKDGIPKGEYQVYITGAAKVIGTKPNGDPIRESLIERKFTRPDESGLTIKLEKSTVFDIQVTKPAKQEIL